ncbi:putative membrane protein YdfJ with MMPL/SSD domain [Pseudomonas nitritireducens]|uniref:Putative membrane protein YdfJ with MMPL/SSD domain n=1 Tax=Pseudomonas nitroreducens TaxID=46680 RepID=A0A7W7KH69_PSENT|nr:hypothetical protein [Pseudomonas nitritireducens]MBB4862168.1 putative membrane protein YdfJ with MMPL/SSD domain [Pseudomonas nitritireducens]
MTRLICRKAARPFAAVLLAWLSIGLVPAYAAESTPQVPTNEKPHGQSPGQAPTPPASQQKQKDEGRTDDNSQVQSTQSREKQQHKDHDTTHGKGTTPEAD